MAETSKILSPEKTVIIPDSRAGCSLAESITAKDIAGMRAKISWSTCCIICKYNS